MSYKHFKETIESHPIFDKLKLKDENESNGTRADQLMQVQDGNLFIWSNEDSSFYATNLRISLDEETPTVQTLGCSSPPLFEVRSITFNSAGNCVALIGSRGVSVVTLPPRWGRQTIDAQKQFCKCTPIAERFFTTCIMVQLVKAAWHPGSPTDTHLCLLLSDNTFRIYDFTSDNQMPVQVHRLGPYSTISSSRYSLTASTYSLSSAIGETVVSFSFAPPVEVQEKRKKILQARSKDYSSTVLLHPVYLLQGDGDVLLLLTSVVDNRYRKGLMHGPLTMRPPAEDNYGADACSILVLQNSPSVIAVATASGKIHHCVALTMSTNYDSDDDLSETQSTASWPASVLSVSGGAQNSEFTPPTLYVYETVEVDLELISGNLSEDEMENHIITLHSDPLLQCRYHCCTRVGVHTVVLPWMEKITSFFENDEEHKDGLMELAQDQPCVVEHIVCTKPTPSSKACALKGFTFATNPLFGPSLLCLTSDNRCMSLPLLTSFRPAPPPLLPSGEELDQTEETTIVAASSPVRNIMQMDFQDHIRSILKRDISQPLLRYEPSSRDSLLDSECSQMISRVTQVLRKEYILKQKLARDAIEKRMSLIVQQKAQQAEDLATLRDKQQELTDNAESLAEKYEECVERQEDLTKRLENVLKNVHSKVPVLSKAEMEMSKELNSMQDQMKHLQNKIKQVKIKFEYQNKPEQGEGEGATSDSKSASGLGANPLHTQKFKDILLEKGQKIHELVKKVNGMKKQVGM